MFVVSLCVVVKNRSGLFYFIIVRHKKKSCVLPKGIYFVLTELAFCIYDLLLDSSKPKKHSLEGGLVTVEEGE